MMTYLIAGLGNAGMRYRHTKHNLGFMVVDAFVRRKNACFTKGPGAYKWARITDDDSEIVLIKPMTYMNRSGIAVADARQRLHIPLQQCLVVVDDLALPLGQLRLRARGSDGGHRGLVSIIRYLHSQDLPRLRMGIEEGTHSDTIRYVLTPFRKKQTPVVNQMIEKAVEAIDYFVLHGIHMTMNAFNTTS